MLRFVIKYITYKRLINMIKAYASYFLAGLIKKPIVWGLPPIVMIEPTNVCNLKCPLCPSGADTLNRNKGFMDLTLLKKLVDEVSEYAFMLILWNQGEPFLNKDFIQMCEYAASKKIALLVSTNANILPNAEKIVSSGIERLIISLDGATQDTYNKYRINGNLQTVIDNVRKIVAAKKKLKSSTPRIVWQFIVMKHNEHEVDEIKRLSSALEVDTLSLKTAQIYSKEDINTYLPTNPKYRRYKVEGDNFELKYGVKNKCRRLWTQPVVNWDGEVAVCCFDKDNDFKIGNIKNKDLKELWKNKAFMKMRKTILTNRKSIPMCLNCGEGVSLKIKKI